MIRTATETDVPRLIELIVELASYERAADQAVATPELLRAALFGADAVAGAHLACPDAQPESVIGMAIWFRNFSTWTGRPGIYLEDLFVTPEHRGEGHGKALLRALAAHAVERDYTRVEWAVLDWNTPSIGFYRSIGANPNDGWTTFRLTGPALRSLGTAEVDAAT